MTRSSMIGRHSCRGGHRQAALTPAASTPILLRVRRGFPSTTAAVLLCLQRTCEWLRPLGLGPRPGRLRVRRVALDRGDRVGLEDVVDQAAVVAVCSEEAAPARVSATT